MYDVVAIGYIKLGWKNASPIFPSKHPICAAESAVRLFIVA